MSDPTPNQPDDAEAPEAGDTEERPAAAPFDDEAPTTQWQAVGDEAPEGQGEGDAEPEPDPLAEVMAERDAAMAEAADWKSRAYRISADLDNARKRFAKEREEMRKFGIEGLLRDMLPIIDNLERAVEHAESKGTDGLTDGVKMVLRQFNTTLKTKGAEPFDALGQPFDPQVHEAMTEMPTADYAPGHVASVFQRGWRLNGRLVRPAMVVVARAPDPAPADEAPADAAPPAEDADG